MERTDFLRVFVEVCLEISSVAGGGPPTSGQWVAYGCVFQWCARCPVSQHCAWHYGLKRHPRGGVPDHQDPADLSPSASDGRNLRGSLQCRRRWRCCCRGGRGRGGCRKRPQPRSCCCRGPPVENHRRPGHSAAPSGGHVAPASNPGPSASSSTSEAAPTECHSSAVSPSADASSASPLRSVPSTIFTHKNSDCSVLMKILPSAHSPSGDAVRHLPRPGPVAAGPVVGGPAVVSSTSVGAGPASSSWRPCPVIPSPDVSAPAVLLRFLRLERGAFAVALVLLAAVKEGGARPPPKFLEVKHPGMVNEIIWCFK